MSHEVMSRTQRVILRRPTKQTIFFIMNQNTVLNIPAVAPRLQPSQTRRVAFCLFFSSIDEPRTRREKMHPSSAGPLTPPDFHTKSQFKHAAQHTSLKSVSRLLIEAPP
jgi:hypothetical protein